MRLLVAVANHGTKNQKYAEHLIATFRALPFETDIVVSSNIPKNYGADVEVRLDVPTENPRSLPFAHRRLFAERQDDYDLFLYTEDDMEITGTHISAFLDALKLVPEDCLPGFVRYETTPGGGRSFPDIHGPYRWDMSSIFESGGKVFARYTNEHSGCYLLTRAQLKACVISGNYDVAPHEGRHPMLESAATDPYARCGFRKTLCLTDIDAFCIHHMPNLYVGRLGVMEGAFRAQIARLIELARSDEPRGPLFEAETLLQTPVFDRNYLDLPGTDIGALIRKERQRILTVGFEPGLVETHLAAEGHKVTTIPMDAVFALAAAESGVRVMPPDLDLALAGLAEEVFDVILLDDVLPHVPEPVAFLRRLVPLLGEGGRALIVHTNAAALNMARRRRRVEGGDFAATRYHFTDAGTVRRWVREAGLRPRATVHRVPARFSAWSRRSLGLADGLLADIGIVEAKA